MLTKEQAIGRAEGHRWVVDRLTQRANSHYVRHAERMLALYRQGIGRTRGELHDGVRRILRDEPDCPPRRMEAFCKLLDEAGVAEYERDEAGRAASLRRRVFHAAAAFHPLVTTRDRLFEHDAAEVRERIAKDLGEPWESIAARLFDDVIEFHRLKAFPGYASPRDLLSRYNVAQLQAALYSATRLTVWAREDFATVVRYAKLARLLHRIAWEPGPRRYRLDLDGPASVLRESRRYGVNMARFLPALLACRGWELRATLQRNRGGWKSWLTLSPEDGYSSHLPEPEEFDSTVEAGFAKKWGDGARDGWTLRREGGILHHRQKVFVPDFALEHEDGRRVLLEIVGFWTPEYLAEKAQTLREFAEHRILLAVAAGEGPVPDQVGPVLRYKTALNIGDVLAALRAAADAPPGSAPRQPS